MHNTDSYQDLINQLKREHNIYEIPKRQKTTERKTDNKSVEYKIEFL